MKHLQMYLGWLLVFSMPVWGQGVGKVSGTLPPFEEDLTAAPLEIGSQGLLYPLNTMEPPESSQALLDEGDSTLENPLLAKGDGTSKNSKGEKKPPKKVEFTGQLRLRYESQQNFDLVYNRSSLDPPASDNDDNFFLSRPASVPGPQAQ